MPVSILDNLKKIKQLDSQNMLGSLQLLSKQVEQIYNTAQDLKIPANYKNIQNVVVLGMGGSALGADLIRKLFADELKVPVEIVNSYNIPKFLNNKTLVIASSYSGGTEEVVEAVKKAKAKKAKIVVISAGGKLKAFAKVNKLPALIFTTENNPCGSPRMGLGYSIVGQLILFSKVGLLKLSTKQVKEIIKTLAYYDTLFGVLTPEKENSAKQLARKTIDKSILYVASEHLLGSAHIACNQMNENAKRMSAYFAIPELNHHLMEGMANPASNKNNLLFIMLESGNYSTRVKKRYDITKKVLDKNNIKHASYKTQEKDKLLEACELLVLGSYISYYSALLKNIDPTDIPFVDFFKKELSR
ncbi:SIS domain-containing protein [Patescibacteria group bacterium]|nr:SIS domain-containing protein [Patescibacteria group bacterium]